jgi:hypothetical protein
MRKNIARIAAASLFIATLAAAPLLSLAQDTTDKAPVATDTTPAPKAKKKGETFTGSLTAVDTNAMTLTISNLVLYVNADTVIKSGSRPAKLSDAVAGQPTRGTYEKGADGKLAALTVHLNSKAGGKGGGKGGSKKKKSATDGADSTASPAAPAAN